MLMLLKNKGYFERLDTEVATVVAAGLARVATRPNNMARVAAALSPPKQALFHVTYALMRTIDDFVDEEFMGRTPAQRDVTRADAFATVDLWQAQAVAAADGRFVGRSDSYEPLLFSVMNKVVGASAIGPAPWCALADAMRADIREGALPDWQAFADYAEGAAVAPASIFIYILAADVDDDLKSRIDLPLATAEYARALAIFCYLVHILRDLSDDAGRAERLLTIPDAALAACSLDKAALSRAAAGDHAVDVTPLAQAIIAHAAPFRDAATRAVADLASHIRGRERLVIETLFALYDAQFAAIAARPSGIADGSVALGATAIGKVLSRLAGVT